MRLFIILLLCGLNHSRPQQAQTEDTTRQQNEEETTFTETLQELTTALTDTPEVTTTALPQDKTELTDEKPEVTTKENDDNISQTTLTPVQNTIKEQAVVTSSETGVETTTNKIQDITDTIDTENKEDLTNPSVSDNDSTTVETSTINFYEVTTGIANEDSTKLTFNNEDNAVEDLAVEEYTEINIVENTSIQESVSKRTKPQVTLYIQNQSQRKEVFTRGNVFGLQCEATSKVDIDIEYSWTKNGRFVDLSGSRIFLESEKRGNLVILKPSDEDEGLYQCVASNSEGVVFSRVIQVESKQKKNSIARIPQRIGSGGRSLDFNNDLHIVLPASNGRFEAENIMIVESQPYVEPDNE